MVHVELFLVLPVYEECESQPFYLNRIKVLDYVAYLEYRNAVEKVRTFFSHENYDGYYDSENVKAFLQPIDMMEDCYPKLSLLLRKSLMDWGSDWRRNKKATEEDGCLCLGMEITDETLCEMAKRQSLDGDNGYLLLANGALRHADSCMEVCFHENQVKLACCDMSVMGLSDWFSKNRKPARKFHLSPKHGENGKGAHPEHKGDRVSVLLCSKEIAEKLLNLAIGIDVEGRTLYFYDVDNQKYIEFKQEADHVYHGFHLSDADAVRRIPQEVIRKIEQVVRR